MKKIWLSICAAILVALCMSAPASASTSEPWLAPDLHVTVDQAVQTPLAAVAGDQASSCSAGADCAVDVAAFAGYGACNDAQATALPSRCYGVRSAGDGDEDDDAVTRPGIRT